MDKFDTICRTCNTVRSNLVSLFSKSPINESLTLYDILCSVYPSFSIQNNDKLPQQICYFCLKQLEIAYKFNLQCKNSYDELWKIVTETIKNEELPKSKQKDYLESTKHEKPKDDEEVDSRSYTEEVLEGITNVVENPEFLDEEEIEMILEDNPESSDSIENSVEASFECKQCDKKYLTSNGLLMHRKLAHKKISTEITETTLIFKCNNCPKVCDSKEDLKAHSWLEHKVDSKIEFTCYICQKVFIGKNKLDHHMLYHGKHQYQCPVKDCRRTFNVKYKVTDHLKRFHGIILSSTQVKTLKPAQADV